MYLRNYRKLHAKQTHKERHLKSRKIGKTTGCCFFCLDNVAYRKNVEAVTMAHEQQKASGIFNNVVRPAWTEPERRYPTIRSSSKEAIEQLDKLRTGGNSLFFVCSWAVGDAFSLSIARPPVSVRVSRSTWMTSPGQQKQHGEGNSSRCAERRSTEPEAAM